MTGVNGYELVFSSPFVNLIRRDARVEQKDDDDGKYMIELLSSVNSWKQSRRVAACASTLQPYNAAMRGCCSEAHSEGREK